VIFPATLRRSEAESWMIEQVRKQIESVLEH
jgi:hypothetical protein